MSLAKAFAEYEDLTREVVLQETWGHLRHHQRVKYYGKLLFTYTAWGDLTLIQETFEEIDSNPWFYERMHDQLDSIWKEYGLDKGKIYLWDGWFMEYKNGNCHWSGELTKMEDFL